MQLRRAHPPAAFRFYGSHGEVDDSPQSRSIAWVSGDLYVMVNAWWEQLTFEIQEPGRWHPALATAEPAARDERSVTLVPRSIVVLQR